MKLMIVTQYRENYAFTPEGEVDGQNPHWKNKGGTIYILENATKEEAVACNVSRFAKMTPPSGAFVLAEHIFGLVEQRNDYCQETVIHVELIEDDATPWEEWETPVMLTRPGA